MCTYIYISMYLIMYYIYIIYCTIIGRWLVIHHIPISAPVACQRLQWLQPGHEDGDFSNGDVLVGLVGLALNPDMRIELDLVAAFEFESVIGYELG